MTDLSLYGIGLMLIAIFLDGWAVKPYQNFVDLAILGAGFILLIIGNNQ